MPNEAKAGVLQGTLDLMVLQMLATPGPQHGYAMAARIEQVSSGAIQLNRGRSIQACCAWNSAGSCAQRERTETNRRARYYRITASGRRQLQAEKAEWARTWLR
jgi:DNA-binding PadR family transcriptional regulator